jgi:AraC family transcriptional regulator, regulatory protein of adaptative response / methylated-DNA-[protein]-cysteine methyltransferase
MGITYSITDTKIGRLLVASSEKGLCMVSVGKSDNELERKIHKQFPSESVKRDDPAMGPLAADVKGRVEGKNLDVKVPVDLRGTPFQMDVWKEMLRIPAGSTRSYADVAKKIGRPKAFRAVANACGANPVPIVVPCHRVVASAGQLGGYGLGLDRKIAILAAEGVSNPRWHA